MFPLGWSTARFNAQLKRSNEMADFWHLFSTVVFFVWTEGIGCLESVRKISCSRKFEFLSSKLWIKLDSAVCYFGISVHLRHTMKARSSARSQGIFSSFLRLGLKASSVMTGTKIRLFLVPLDVWSGRFPVPTDLHDGFIFHWSFSSGRHAFFRLV